MTPELLTPTPDRKNPRPRNPAHPARQPGHSHTRTPESGPRDEAKPRLHDQSPTNHGSGSELRDVSIRPMTAVNTFLQVDLADVDGFTREFLEELQFGQGVTLARATTNDLYMALARTVRQQLMSRWLDTVSTQMRAQAKVVAYLSAEYLLGRQLDNALLAAGLTETAERSMRSLGLDLDRLRDAEVEPGLGNGGLGRLAACFIDSLATLQIPAVGYGIRYEYGIFRQTFVDGGQVEQPDFWLANGSPWEFPRPEMAVTVRFGGRTATLRGCRRGHPVAVGPRLGGARRPLQLHGARVPQGQRQHAAAVERQGDARLRPEGLQRRRLPAGGPRPGLRREHQQGAVPEGLDPAGQGTAPAAAVFLRRLLAARLHRQHPAARLRHGRGCPSG